MLVKSLMIANQTVLIFDLQLSNYQRAMRHAHLDAQLSVYFAQQNIKIAIEHQAGQQARLKIIQHDYPNLTLKTRYFQLAISYALPYAAVSWSPQPIGLDLVALTAFNLMSQQEIKDFSKLYFPTSPLIVDIKKLAQHWASYEAKLKLLHLPLQEWSQLLESRLNQVVSIEEEVTLDQGQGYYLSVASLR